MTPQIHILSAHDGYISAITWLLLAAAREMVETYANRGGGYGRGWRIDKAGEIHEEMTAAAAGCQ